ncbi:MAG: ABC transporter permease [Bacteroides sp.]|nr:ABC transporter permease [Bacillota bacterium]MCM1393359.1 ABC transporter permease [[Eubacterium] siraeum]MCM1454913.1 ABC transporter permease [Bacteroides sp.]
MAQLFKISLKNLASKPLRAVVTVLAIAVAAAMIFAMLSFSLAVYEYIYSTQTATSGRSDIVISTNSLSDRITSVAKPLEELDGVEYICPSLTIYALLNGEYVQVRGFEAGGYEYLQNIDVKQGDKSQLDQNIDNIVISEDAAKKFGLAVGDSVSLSLSEQISPKLFFVCAISKKSGYFLNDAPFLFLGRVEGISRLLTNISASGVCNEIYIKASEGVDVDALIERISAMPEYSSMLVARTGGAYIKEQADSLSAPVVLAGAAVFALAIAVVVLLNMMSESEKIALISKYSVIGATKRQIVGIFMLESVFLACLGAVVGLALAAGIFVGILKVTLSSTVLFSISVWRLFLAAAIGLFSAIISSLIPILRSFKGTIRQNQLSMQKSSRLAKVLCPVMIAVTVILVVVEFAVPSATAITSVFSLISALVTLGVCISPLMRLGAKAGDRISNPSVKVASVNIRRDRRFSRSVVMLGVGMTVSMMLFMAWAMTKSVFGDYVADFSDMVFVTNVRASVDLEQFEQVDGVDSANKIIWRQGELAGENFNKTMNILGSENALDIIDFAYVTPREDVKNLLLASDPDKPYVFLDKALTVLYGVQAGDTLDMTVDGNTKAVTVGGILEHRLFSGNYIVISERTAQELFDVSVDTVLITADGKASDIVGNLRTEFANNNYYVVDVLTAYKWEMQSSNAVFDLIGTLAIVVAAFIFAITVFAAQVGRSTDEKGRTALLNAGMSKRALFKAEISEYSAIAIISYALSFAVSVLLTACLIHALRLFGMYFEFMYEAWVVALVGGVMAAGYALVPVAFNFKKGYTIKKSTR